jgi:protein transport protein YIF1
MYAASQQPNTSGSGSSSSYSLGGNGQMGEGGMGSGLTNENAALFGNMAMEHGKNVWNSQTNKWMPGVNTFWNSLKIYFKVDNTYVLKKLMMILHPMGVKKNQEWKRKDAEAEGYEQSSDVRTKWALPKDDTCAPDLYIPLMSFITYVLLFGLCTGTSSDFSPEVLITAVWRCFIVQLCEVVVVYVGLNLINSSLPFLDIYAYTGYKYVGLCVGIIARVLGYYLSSLISLYCSGMLAFFFLKSMVNIIPVTEATGSLAFSRHWVLLALCALQFLVAVFLSWF